MSMKVYQVNLASIKHLIQITNIYAYNELEFLEIFPDHDVTQQTKKPKSRSSATQRNPPRGSTQLISAFTAAAAAWC